jgi:hypothetical protein
MPGAPFEERLVYLYHTGTGIIIILDFQIFYDAADIGGIYLF